MPIPVPFLRPRETLPDHAREKHPDFLVLEVLDDNVERALLQ